MNLTKHNENYEMKQHLHNPQIKFTENFLGMLKKQLTQASSQSLRPSVLSLIRHKDLSGIVVQRSLDLGFVFRTPECNVIIMSHESQSV